MALSKNSRVGRVKDAPNKDCLPKYCAANVGASWKTGSCKGGSNKLRWSIKREGRYMG